MTVLWKDLEYTEAIGVYLCEDHEFLEKLLNGSCLEARADRRCHFRNGNPLTVQASWTIRIIKIKWWDLTERSKVSVIIKINGKDTMATRISDLQKKNPNKTGVALQESVASTMEALYTHFRAGGL